jgi:hypothetical protein
MTAAEATSTAPKCTAVGVMKPRMPRSRFSWFVVSDATTKAAPTMAPDAVPTVT